MGQTYHLINAETSAPVDSPIIYPQRTKDESGLFQVELTGTTPTFTIKLKGRASALAPWHTIETFAETDLVDNTAASQVAIMPEMKVSLAAIGGTTPVASAWLTE